MFEAMVLQLVQPQVYGTCADRPLMSRGKMLRVQEKTGTFTRRGYLCVNLVSFAFIVATFNLLPCGCSSPIAVELRASKPIGPVANEGLEGPPPLKIAIV